MFFLLYDFRDWLCKSILFLRDKCSEKFPKDAMEEATCGLIASHVFKNNSAWCGTDAALITRFFIFKLIVGD